MKRYFLPLLSALTLAALLAACAPEAPAPVQTTPPPETSPASEPARALTQEEVAAVNEAFASWTEENGVTIATPVSGFFTSYYDDVTRLDFAAFLQYFPDDGTLSAGDEAEAAALAALPGYPWGISPGSVPIHRITRASVDAALERYAGITSAGLADTSGVPYLEDYDAWYTFTSDFGPGMFVCAGGQVDEAAGTALLWSEPWANGHRAELTLQKDGENWHIRAHRNTADQALLERLANLTAEDIGYVLSTPTVPEFLTGREFLKFFVDINSDSIRDPKPLDEYFAEMSIAPEDRDKLLKDYSHGMKNKMQMLVNIIAQPNILLLDEPLTSLDVVVAEEMKNLLRSLKDGRITIFSTHILDLALDLCDEIVLLSHGELEVVEKSNLDDHAFKEKIIAALKEESHA